MAYYIVDIVVAAFIIGSMLASGSKGFIACVLGAASTLLAFFIAVTLAGVVCDVTGGLFGLESWFSGKFATSFAKIDGFNADISEKGMEAALAEQNVAAIVARLALKFSDREVAAGSTLAQLLGNASGSLATTILCGLLLFILVKLLVRFLKRALTNVMDNLGPLGKINSLFGVLYGMLWALMVVGLVLAVFTIFPFGGVVTYISKSLFVKYLYEYNPLLYFVSLFL